MSDLSLAVRLILNGGGFEQGLRQMERALGRAATDGERRFLRLSQAAHGFGQAINGVGNRWTALASTAALGAMAKQVADLEHAMTMIGINAQISESKVKALNEEIFRTAVRKDIKISPDTLREAVGTIVADTGDVEFAKRNLGNIGMLARGADVPGADAGGVFSFLKKFNITDETQVKGLLDVWLKQGYAGAFTLKSMARYLPQVGGSLAMGKRTDVAAMRDLGAFLQEVQMNFPQGEPGQTATSAEQFLKVMLDPKKQKGTKKSPGLEEFGVHTYEPGTDKPTPAVKDSRGRIITPAQPAQYIMRPPTALLEDVAKFAADKPQEFSEIFADIEARRAVGMTVQRLNERRKSDPKGDPFDRLHEFARMTGDGSQLEKDSARAAGGVTGAQADFSARLLHAGDKYMSGPLNALSKQGEGKTLEDSDRLVGQLGVSLGAVALGGLAATLGAPVAATGMTLAGLGTGGYHAYQYFKRPDAAPMADLGRAYQGPQRAGPDEKPSWMDGWMANLSTAMAPQLADVLNRPNPAAEAASAANTQAAETQAKAAADQAQAATTIQAAANTIGAGFRGTVTIKVEGPGKVTGLTAAGPVDLTAETGKAMAAP